MKTVMKKMQSPRIYQKRIQHYSKIRQTYHDRGHGKWHLAGVAKNIKTVILSRPEFLLSREEESDIRAALYLLEDVLMSWNANTKKRVDEQAGGSRNANS